MAAGGAEPVDPALFKACFTSWAMSLRPDAPDLIALDGKTMRRSGDERAGVKPIYLASAWASTQRFLLAQEAVEEKDNEFTAILAILDRLAVKGASVTLDAIATNPTIAKAITDKGGDYVLTLKRNRPTLHDEVATYFADPATTGLARSSPTTRIMVVSRPAPSRSATTSLCWLATGAVLANTASGPRQPDQDEHKSRTQRQNHHRYPLFHLFGPPHPRARPRGDPKPLGD